MNPSIPENDDVPAHLHGEQFIIVDQRAGGVMFHRPVGKETPVNVINRTTMTTDMIVLKLSEAAEMALMSLVTPAKQMTRAEIIATLQKHLPKSAVDSERRAA